MAISYWTKLAPNVVVESTRKQYYGKYLCKLVLQVEGGRLSSTPDALDIATALEERVSLMRNYNFGGSWRVFQVELLKTARVEDLERLRTIKNNYRDQCKIRIEEPLVQIYTEDEDGLKEIVGHFTPYMKSSIKSVSFPDSDACKNLLKEDKIITTSDKLSYSYKVMLRDGSYSPDSKKQLLNYFDNLGDLVKITKGVRRNLESSHSYIWGGYFYRNDTSTLTFISLICPNIVGKIHEIVRVR